jgi:hypothetical protein
MDNKAPLEKEGYHLFAWQGFAYNVPAEWNLAEYKHSNSGSYARLYDDSNIRLDFEWLYPRRPVKIEAVRRRYDEIAASMNAVGAAAENIADLPRGWSACLYSMPDGKRLLAAFRFVPEERFFCLLKMYFENASRREADRIIRMLASSFRLYEQGLVPWAVYDVDFQLHKDFRLVATSFQAGRKLLVFEWRLRRFYLWFFSLADILLKKHSMAGWCAEHLNAFKALSGVRFSAVPGGEIQARRRWRRFYGNMEPVSRGCLNYKAWCLRLPDKDQILLGVLNYRHPEDISFLTSGFKPTAAPDST